MMTPRRRRFADALGRALAAACLLCGGLVRGQSGDAPPEERGARAHAIVAAARAAMGSDADRAKVSSVTARAHARGPGGRYTMTVRASAAGVEMAQQPEQGDAFVAVVGRTGAWSGSGEELHRLERDVAEMVRSHAFQWTALHVEDYFAGLAAEGETFFAGRRCHRLRGLDALEMPCAIYFDAETHLLAGYEIVDPIEEGTVVIRFVSWRKVAGVQLPAEVVATDADGDFIIDYHTITVNDVDDARFETPATLRR